MTDRPLRIAIASNFVAEEIRDSLSIWFDELGVNSTVAFSPYDQIIQQLTSRGGSFQSCDLAVVIVQLKKWIHVDPAVPGVSNRDNMRMFAGAVAIDASHTGARPLLIICAPSTAGSEEGMRDIEAQLKEEFSLMGSVTVISNFDREIYYPVNDYAAFFAEDSPYLEGPQYSQVAFATLGTLVARWVYSKVRGGRKVIVVDCDNTLWSGVCGEVGSAGIELSPMNQALQNLLQQQSKFGRLVCLCSKNNEGDVFDVFEKRHDMILQLSHITATMINWSPKFTNMRQLATDLHLGLDSFIFLDDDAAECEAMKHMCPEVLTLQVPRDIVSAQELFRRVWDFDTGSATTEDQKRRLYYQQNTAREIDRRSCVSEADFLHGLNLKVIFAQLSISDLDRVIQLYQRVNQFTLNGERLTRATLDWDLVQGNCHTIRASDRFGDYGLVGIIIFRERFSALEVFSLILSCRALGRGLEKMIATEIATVARKIGADRVTFNFKKTQRNDPIEIFLRDIGVEGLSPGLATVRVDSLMVEAHDSIA